MGVWKIYLEEERLARHFSVAGKLLGTRRRGLFPVNLGLEKSSGFAERQTGESGRNYWTSSAMVACKMKGLIRVDVPLLNGECRWRNRTGGGFQR